MSDNFYNIRKGINLGPQASEPVNGTNGDIYYNSTLNKFRQYENGVWKNIGSGGGTGKNYLSDYNNNPGNGDFENAVTTGWSLFSTTLTSLIPTGSITAGAASVITFDIVNTGQLAGGNSLRTASSAAWAAGQGFISSPFTIDIEDQAKAMTFKAYYKAFANPANGNFSGTSANTFAVYIYDVTNSAWIQPSGVYGLTQSSGVGMVSGTFQSTSNSTQYRIAVLAVNASAGAITMYWDDFFVGPQSAPIGPVLGDWQKDINASGNFTSNTVYNVFKRRVGDSMEIMGFVTFTGAPNATTFSLNIPDGKTIDVNKFPEDGVHNALFGYAYANDAGSTNYSGAVIYAGSLTSFTIATATGSGAGIWSNTVPFSFNNTDSINFHLKVPIVGWSSNVQSSGDTDTRVVSFKIDDTVVTPTSAGFGGANTLIFNGTPLDDTHGTYNPTTGQYTVPVSGKYLVRGRGSIQATYASGNQSTITVYQNSVLKASGPTRVSAAVTQNVYNNIQTELVCNAGDIIELRLVTAATGPSIVVDGVGSYSFEVNRISGPSVIAASETVACKYCNTLSSVISTSSGSTALPFNVKNFDTHNAFNTSTGQYTVPVSGIYRAESFLSTGTATTTGQAWVLIIMKNGVNEVQSLRIGTGSANTSLGHSAGTIIKANAGDIIEVRAFMDTGGSITLLGGEISQFSIHRIGI